MITVAEYLSKRKLNTNRELSFATRTFIVSGASSEDEALATVKADPRYSDHPNIPKFGARIAVPFRQGDLIAVETIYADCPIVWGCQKTMVGPKHEQLRWDFIHRAPEIFPNLPHDLSGASFAHL